MAIGKQLQQLAAKQPRYKAFFLDYDKLKKTVDSGDAAALMALLQKELNQVNDIAEVEWEVLMNQLKSWLSKGGVEDITSLENLCKALLQLHEFSEANYMGFRKVMTRCGEQQSTSSCAWFLSRVDNAPFRQRNWDVALAQLGQLYAIWNKMSKVASGPTTQAIGECGSEAYLVPTANVMRVKVALLKRLRPAAKQVRVPTTSNTRAANEVTYDFKQACCRVYLDNPRGDQYAERYRRCFAPSQEQTGGSSVLLQCRLATGEGAQGPDAEVHVDVEESSGATTDIVLPQKLMPSLLSGRILPERFPNSKALEEARNAIKSSQLRPSVSVMFNRSSFGGESGELLITLDEDLHFRDEAIPDAKAWCLSAGKGSAGAAGERQVAFVGGILRIWRPAGAQSSPFNPEEYGLEASDLQPVPSFSEALHGMALIHRELASPLPPWIPSEALPTPSFTSTLLLPQQAEPTVAVAPAPTPTAKPLAAVSSMSSAAATRGRRLWDCFFGAPAAAAQDTNWAQKELRVDCKTPLSIERTLLRWLRSTVILASLSAFLVSLPTYGDQVNGILLGLASVLFVILPLRSYVKSSLDLMSPQAKQPKVDRILPMVLSGALFAVLGATVVVDVIYDNHGSVKSA